ncbi:putative LRR and NB-ARC domains-containing disease resistance protein [Tripterygium wilfordii]|uniref:Putative LRR and NB-ARC domains-containing disease resistance protein n=1 Tax=Tripterygium wilfordii TaxID=458696 RepID=A0A7J7BTA6_TRIWF|nr:putative LRR and NB-ARC domains-containing disease resistance protein [Tripterygium wilfordii]
MAEMLLGGAFLSAFLQVAFDRIASSKVIDYFMEKKLDDALLEKLEITLMSIQVVLDDAEEKHITKPLVKKWLDKLQDAVYDAEDLLYQISTEAQRSKIEAEFCAGTSKVCNSWSMSCNSFEKTIEPNVKKIIDRLEFLVKQKKVLGLKEGVGSKELQRLPTTSLVEESSVVGRDNDVERVIKLVLSDDLAGRGGHVPVIAIVGVGGIGKTTLAQLVYNAREVNECFDLKVWVFVSERFDVIRITKTILEAVTSKSSDTNDFDMLQTRLKENLKGKKFIVVLDDVWNEEQSVWEALRKPINSCAHGSKIIVTTRNESVTSVMRPVSTCQLQPISNGDCWLLLSQYAFENGQSDVSLNLEVMREELVKKCCGLPLAAKALGGLLRSKRNPEEWKEILRSEMWYLHNEASGIFSVLRLSYHHLPSHLKRCFAYCSLFPKGYAIRKEELVLLWLVEDLLPDHRSKKKAMEIGYEYVKDLESRSFFQSLHLYYDSWLVMHDLFNDFAKIISGEFCSTLDGANPVNVGKKTRHLSYFMSTDKQLRINNFEAMRLQTFLSINQVFFVGNFPSTKEVTHDLLPRLLCLRVLSLSGYNIEKLPDSIRNLKLLRYLDLSYTPIQKLPETISSLYNLEVLMLSSCRSLTELPSTMGRLINLHYLDMRYPTLRFQLPWQMMKLKDLQVLPPPLWQISDGSSIKELRDLLHIHGELYISGLQNLIHARDALEANLRGKMHLEKLIFKWDFYSENSKDVEITLENLQPHANLKELKIECYGGTRFPDWLGSDSLFNMVSIHLQDCKYCCLLPPLGQLPSLKDLTIAGFDAVVTVGREFHLKLSSTIKPFQSLESLTFKNMSEWREWIPNVDQGDFSSLRVLSIESCPKLTSELPKFLPALTEFRLVECPEFVDSLPRAPGLLKLTIIGCSVLESQHEVLRISECSSQNTPCMLRELEIETCMKLELPVHYCYTSLRDLSLSSSCDSLEFFPLSFFTKLCRLELKGCRSLKSISVSEDTQGDLGSLESLNIWNCPNFEYFHLGGLRAPRMGYLSLRDCESLKVLPEHMCTLFPSLVCLILSACPMLESFPQTGLPRNLVLLDISQCNKLIANRSQWGLEGLHSLKTLSISFKCVNVESFPEEGLLPRYLSFLSISDLPNLTTFDGKMFQLLSSLGGLQISRCPKLRCFPEEGLPTSLYSLNIWECPLLEERCQIEKGEDWSKIAHIDKVTFSKDEILSYKVT